MNKAIFLKHRHHLLERMLQESLQRRTLVEVSIREQMDELKRLETSLEKMQATCESHDQGCVIAQKQPVGR